jgi:alkyl sulfatase BDS1-like metallo-beta-lactamase superfamily hydrolase
MYGNLLPHSPTGQVGAGLGPTTSLGTVTLIPPTDVIRQNGEKRKIAGLDFGFWMAPDSEAPSEMFFYIPSMKALCTAEDAVHNLHNTYSLRGAKLRNPLAWSKYLNEAIYNWGDKVEVLFAPHHWSTIGNKRIVEHLKHHRDLYRYINDQPLRLANHGFRMIEIAEMLDLPKSLQQVWSARGFLRQRQSRPEIDLCDVSRLVQRQSCDAAPVPRGRCRREIRRVHGRRRRRP